MGGEADVTGIPKHGRKREARAPQQSRMGAVLELKKHQLIRKRCATSTMDKLKNLVMKTPCFGTSQGADREIMGV